jgi:hypothetical protein
VTGPVRHCVKSKGVSACATGIKMTKKVIVMELRMLRVLIVYLLLRMKCYWGFFSLKGLKTFKSERRFQVAGGADFQ